MSDDTLYWLFSTIAQAYGAIIGIIGLLVVYRLENQSRLRGSIMTKLLDEHRIADAFVNVRVAGWSPEDMIHHYRYPDSETKKNIDGLGNRIKLDLEDGITKIDRSVELGKAIRKGFRSFMKFHLGLIIVPLVLIPLAPMPFSYPQAVIGPVILWGVLIALIIALSISCKRIWSIAITLLDERR